MILPAILFLAVGVITPAYSLVLPEWLFYRAARQYLTAGLVTSSAQPVACQHQFPVVLDPARPLRLAAVQFSHQRRDIGLLTQPHQY